SELPTEKWIDWRLATFGRGFAEGVIVVRRRVGPAELDPLFQAAPVEHLWLRTVNDIRGLVKYPRLGQLKFLTIETRGVKDGLATNLIANPHLTALRRLEIWGYPHPISARMRAPLLERFGTALVL